MRNFISIMCFAMVIIMFAATLTACGSSLNGTYDLVEISKGDQVYNKDELDALKQNGDQATLIIQDDTATLNSWGDIQLLTVDTSAMTMTDSNGFSASYVLNGNTLIFSEDDIKMIFEKR